MQEQTIGTIFTYGTTWGGGFYGGCAGTICGIAGTILYVINNILVPLIFAIAFITFLYGVASKYIFSHGDAEKVGQGHKLILWGLVGFAVMISIWGLVNIVANTFGLGGQYVPNAPYTPGTRNTNFNTGATGGGIQSDPYFFPQL